MSRTVNFRDNEGQFLGKNGMFKATGLDLLLTADKELLIVAPITSKGKVGKCEIWIPVNAIEELIRTLYQMIPEGTQEFFPITSVSRADISAKFGPIAQFIPDSDMVEIARKLANDYCNQLFSGSLEVIVAECDFLPEPDGMFTYCADCNHIFIGPEGDECPGCQSTETDYVCELAEDEDMKELDKEFEEEFPDFVHTKLFDLAAWVEKHQEFMTKHNLIYEPVPEK